MSDFAHVKVEFVESAAIRIDGKVFTGAAHPAALMQAMMAGVAPGIEISEQDSGFVSNQGRWLTREEALIIGERQGQVGAKRNKGEGHCLDSEYLLPVGSVKVEEPRHQEGM